MIKNTLFKREDTGLFTNEDIQKEVNQCLLVLTEKFHAKLYCPMEKITAKIDEKLRDSKVCGRCNYSGSTKLHVSRITITINSKYLAVGEPDNIHSTIMHECIHCIIGCDNHRSKFQYYAKLVNAIYGLNVATHTVDKAFMMYRAQILDSKIKYIITCKKCGAQTKYQRKTGIVQDIEWAQQNNIEPMCYCNICKSHNFKLDIVR